MRGSRRQTTTIGRIAQKPTVTVADDGSREIAITLATFDRHRRSDGTVGAHVIECVATLPADAPDGIYAHLRKGDMVAVELDERKGLLGIGEPTYAIRSIAPMGRMS